MWTQWHHCVGGASWTDCRRSVKTSGPLGRQCVKPHLPLFYLYGNEILMFCQGHSCHGIKPVVANWIRITPIVKTKEIAGRFKVNMLVIVRLHRKVHEHLCTFFHSTLKSHQAPKKFEMKCEQKEINCACGYISQFILSFHSNLHSQCAGEARNGYCTTAVLPVVSNTVAMREEKIWLIPKNIKSSSSSWNCLAICFVFLWKHFP